MPGRNFIAGQKYRYGYQSQEEDPEIWGGAVSYKYRMEDPRLGRFFSVDPLAAKYSYNSPYAFSENRVIDGVELEGLEVVLIGFGGGGNAVIGYGWEAGIMVGPEGAYKYTSSGPSLASNLGGGAYLTIAFFPDMPHIQDATGVGYSYGISGGEGWSIGTNAVYSSGYYGLNYQIGGGISVLPFQAQGAKTDTELGDRINSKSALKSEFDKAQAYIASTISANTHEIAGLKENYNMLLKDNEQLYKLLDNSSSLEESERIDGQIGRNNEDMRKNSDRSNTLQKENRDLKAISKVLDNTYAEAQD